MTEPAVATEEPEVAEYPKYLYGPKGTFRIAKDPDEHAQLNAEGWVDTAEEVQEELVQTQAAKTANDAVTVLNAHIAALQKQVAELEGKVAVQESTNAELSAELTAMYAEAEAAATAAEGERPRKVKKA